jgi:hypothetical protein
MSTNDEDPHYAVLHILSFPVSDIHFRAMFSNIPKQIFRYGQWGRGLHTYKPSTVTDKIRGIREDKNTVTRRCWACQVKLLRFHVLVSTDLSWALELYLLNYIRSYLSKQETWLWKWKD